ncbi:Ketopantoate reductase [Minicystis rosea]|nr:Ketopantoate reductase [Minicystis rosea]
MKILVFGRGVIGTLYGWALAKAGHEVDFYVRPGRATTYGAVIPLAFLDARTRLRGELVSERWPVRFREDLPDDHDYDVILLSVQHYRFVEAAAFLGPRTGKATVLVFNNFWVEPQAAAAPLPAGQLVWGFPRAGGGFDEEGVLHGALLPAVLFGTFGAAPTTRDIALRDAFRSAGFTIEETRDFRSWLFTHFVLNSGLQLAALEAGSFPAALSSKQHCRDMVLNVRELFPLLEARGVQPRGEATPFRLPARLLGALLPLALKASAPLRAVVDGHANMDELRSTCRDVLAEARRLGVPVPRLEAGSSLFAR